MRKIRNWPTFMVNYALGLKARRPYRFRNGACLGVTRGIDHAPIVEVFLNEDYGNVTDGAVVVDIGANIGAFTVFAITTARDVQIYAYEPHDQFYAVLLQNLSRNSGRGTPRSFNLAVAADDHGRDLYLRSPTFFFPTLVSRAGEPAQDGVRVPSVTLEQIMESNKLERIDLLKMDCEGAEYEILYACSPCQMGRINEIRMEYHNLDGDEQRVEALIRYLEKSGLAISRLNRTSKTNGTLWARRPEISGHD